VAWSSQETLKKKGKKKDKKGKKKFLLYFCDTHECSTLHYFFSFHDVGSYLQLHG